MKRQFLWFAVLVLVPTFAVGQDKKIEEKGQLAVGRHQVKLKSGQLYELVVEGKGFKPQVLLHAPGESVRETFNFQERSAFKGFFSPKFSAEYNFIVIPGYNIATEAATGPLEYTFTMAPVTLQETAKHEVKVGKGDPKYQNQYPHKAVPIKLEKGQRVVIELNHKGEGDPLVMLVNSKNQEVGRDDDGGGSYNSRLIHTVNESGEYRIICSRLGDQDIEMELKISLLK